MDYKDKIRKLLALAKSPEPEEAKFALLKARKLMAEHMFTRDRARNRAKTFPGVARAFAEQFGGQL